MVAWLAGWWVLALCLAAAWPSAVHANTEQPQRPPTPDDFLAAATFEQRLNAQVPGELTFMNEQGQSVRLDTLWQGRPTVLVLAYYNCPTLCPLTLTELATNLRDISLKPGKDFNVVTISIDPRETSADAQRTRARLLQLYGQPPTAEGWFFLTGTEAAIQRVAEAIGFGYAYDPTQQQYAHPSGLTVLTPAGRVSHYFYGMQYSASDLRLGLVEASAGTIGSPIDKFLLRCYHYDPQTGTYQPVIMNILRIAGTLTVLILGSVVVVLLRRERGYASHRRSAGGAPAHGKHSAG
ncbi:SCO family protein [Kallotenue papyrolyticum]|uniref:SCO family protein n=1 Tax=Kallotenue papyrolyticum TaxID=1325125 RepID=UPI0004922467|nr:SCO family protein [Kallotenue papyrolyticum]